MLALRCKDGDWQVTTQSVAPDIIEAPVLIRARAHLGPDHCFVDSTFRKVLDLSEQFPRSDVVIYEEIET